MRTLANILVCTVLLVPISGRASPPCTLGRSTNPQTGTLTIFGAQKDFFYLDGQYFELATEKALFSCPVGVHQLEFVNSAEPIPIRIAAGRSEWKQAYHVTRDTVEMREPLLKALQQHQMNRAQLLLQAVPAFKDDPDVRWALAVNHETAARRVEAIQDFEFYLAHAPTQEYWPDQHKHAQSFVSRIRKKLGRILVYNAVKDPIVVDNQQIESSSTTWVEPGQYSIKFSSGNTKTVRVRAGRLSFVHEQEVNAPLPRSHFAKQGESTFGESMALWLLEQAHQALSTGDVELVDDLLSEARLLWPDGYYLQSSARRIAFRLRRRTELEVLAAPGVPFEIDRSRYLGSGVVESVWVAEGPHTVRSGDRIRHIESSMSSRSVNLMPGGIVSLEAGLNGGGRTLAMGSNVSCFDLDRITPDPTAPSFSYRRQECPGQQVAGVGIRVDLTLYPLAWTPRFGGLGIGGGFESLNFAQGAGSSFQTEVGLRWAPSGFAPRRRGGVSTEILLQYVRRESTTPQSGVTYPFNAQGEAISTVGSAGLPSIIYQSIEVGFRALVPLPAFGNKFFWLNTDMRLRAVTLPGGDITRGLIGDGTITGGYDFGDTILPGFRIALSPVAWSHSLGITISLQGYIEGNFIGKSSSNTLHEGELSADGQFITRTSPSRYVAINTGLFETTVIDLYYGGLLMIGYHR